MSRVRMQVIIYAEFFLSWLRGYVVSVGIPGENSLAALKPSRKPSLGALPSHSALDGMGMQSRCHTRSTASLAQKEDSLLTQVSRIGFFIYKVVCTALVWSLPKSSSFSLA